MRLIVVTLLKRTADLPNAPTVDESGFKGFEAATWFGVASVAMAHGLNANLVHKWRRLAGKSQAPAPSSALEFVALPLASHAPAAAGDIAIELRRGAVTLKVTWPMAGAASCAAWVREVLR